MLEIGLGVVFSAFASRLESLLPCLPFGSYSLSFSFA
jgi:hypothetical protein